MIIGSGLLAHAFSRTFSQREDVCIYAAGVSNSNCTDVREFAREQQRLGDALLQMTDVGTFVYFGTCSVGDPEAKNSPYVEHKLAMEQLARTHPGHLILRLPQVAGRTPNPHTLLNYLYARVSRSESFNVWVNASRNIIDVDDVAVIAQELIWDDSARKATVNIANAIAYPMLDIVSAMENVIGKRAIYNPVARGSKYDIDIGAIISAIDKAGVKFGDDYLISTIEKCYGNTA
jgi:nucleoside-diphosphate-sugar epimerase